MRSCAAGVALDDHGPDRTAPPGSGGAVPARCPGTACACAPDTPPRVSPARTASRACPAPAGHRRARVRAYDTTLVEFGVRTVAGWSTGQQRAVHQEMRFTDSTHTCRT